jgi:hypothetical protein
MTSSSNDVNPDTKDREKVGGHALNISPFILGGPLSTHLTNFDRCLRAIYLSNLTNFTQHMNADAMGNGDHADSENVVLSKISKKDRDKHHFLDVHFELNPK